MSALRVSVMYPLVTFTLAACSHDAPTKPTTFSGPARLAYVSAAQIHVIDPDGTHDTTVTDATHAVIWYAWDNTNQRVAYLDHNDRRV